MLVLWGGHFCLRFLSGWEDRTLVEGDLPACLGLLPDGGTAGFAFSLQEIVGEEVNILRELAAVEVACLPDVFFGGVSLMAAVQFVEDVLAAVDVA